MPADSDQKLDRRIVRTRTALKEAIIELVLEKGFNAIRVQDIAERADVRAATLYLHYDNKEDLLMSALEGIYDDMFMAISEEELAAYLSTANYPRAEAVFERIWEQRDLYLVLMSGEVPRTMYLRLLRYVANSFRTGIQTRLNGLGIQPEDVQVDLDFLARYMSGALLAFVGVWLTAEEPMPPKQAGQFAMDLLMRGVVSAVAPYRPGSYPG